MPLTSWMTSDKAEGLPECLPTAPFTIGKDQTDNAYMVSKIVQRQTSIQKMLAVVINKTREWVGRRRKSRILDFVSL